jgi:CheY-like chemotaxis protein
MMVENLPVCEPIDPISNQILVAEDHPISMRLLQRNLSDWGFDVATATDGEEALRILESDSAPPLAIIDWMMPKIDGIELCSRVREMSARPYTYLLLLTARNRVAEITISADAGYRWRWLEVDLAYQWDIPVSRHIGNSGLLDGEYSGSTVTAGVQWIGLTTSVRF